MAAHKCNKCLHQAFMKLESGNEEFCLRLDYKIADRVKNCSAFIDPTKLREPEDFLEDLNELITNPTAIQKRKLTKLRKKIAQLRLWGEKELKNKVRKKK